MSVVGRRSSRGSATRERVERLTVSTLASGTATRAISALVDVVASLAPVDVGERDEIEAALANARRLARRRAHRGRSLGELTSATDRTCLAARSSGGVNLVAHSSAPQFSRALSEVKAKLRRQLDDHHDRRAHR